MKRVALALILFGASLALQQPLILVAALFGLLALAPLPARAAEYTLSLDGDDGAEGDPDNPWRTMAKANETLQPGDTCSPRCNAG